MGLTIQGPFVVERPYHVAHLFESRIPGLIVASFSPKSQVNGELCLK